MKDENGFILYIQPTIPIHIVTSGNVRDWLDDYTEQRLIPFPSFISIPCFLTFLSNGHPYIFFHFIEMFFSAWNISSGGRKGSGNSMAFCFFKEMTKIIKIDAGSSTGDKLSYVTGTD